MKRRISRPTWAVVGVVLLAAGGWLLKAGVDGLAYLREWPTMADGSEATLQLAMGVMLIAAALVAGWHAASAPRRD